MENKNIPTIDELTNSINVQKKLVLELAEKQNNTSDFDELRTTVVHVEHANCEIFALLKQLSVYYDL